MLSLKYGIFRCFSGILYLKINFALDYMLYQSVTCNKEKLTGQQWVAMIVYLVFAILKQRYLLQSSLSQLLHFLEVNLFEQKPLVPIFRANPRKTYRKGESDDKQLTLFDY